MTVDSAPVVPAPTPSPVAPSAPTGVMAEAGDASVTLRWSAPVAVGSSPITDYVIEGSTDGGMTWTSYADSVSTGTGATLNGLRNGVAYVFRVKAVSSAGSSIASSSSVAVTPAAKVVEPPKVVTKTATGRFGFSLGSTTLSKKSVASMMAFIDRYSGRAGLKVSVIGKASNALGAKSASRTALARAKSVASAISKHDSSLAVNYTGLIVSGLEASSRQVIIQISWTE